MTVPMRNDLIVIRLTSRVFGNALELSHGKLSPSISLSRFFFSGMVHDDDLADAEVLPSGCRAMMRNQSAIARVAGGARHLSAGGDQLRRISVRCLRGA